MKYILSVVNIMVAFLCFVILLLSSLSENVVYLMMMTLIIGWVMPYLVLLITGLEMLAGFKHARMAEMFNILGVLLCILDIYLTVRLYDKKMMVLLVEYGIMGIVSIVNVVYLHIYKRKHPNVERIEENRKIKKVKNENNGAIV